MITSLSRGLGSLSLFFLQNSAGSDYVIYVLTVRVLVHYVAPKYMLQRSLRMLEGSEWAEFLTTGSLRVYHVIGKVTALLQKNWRSWGACLWCCSMCPYEAKCSAELLVPVLE